MTYPAFPPGIGFANNEFLPIGEVKISILDWGFLHSDATYDVVTTWKGKFFRMEAHLDRFMASLERLRLDPGRTRNDIEMVLHECVARSGLQDCYVEMLCTRGFAPGSRDPRDGVNQFFAFAVPFGWILQPHLWETGLHLWIAPQPRISPHSVDPRVKNYHWLDMVMGQYSAYERSGHPRGGSPNVNALLSDGAGNLAEGPGFNLFVVRDGALYTPKTGVLEGVSRSTVMQLAREQGVAIHEIDVPMTWLDNAQEVFATSSGGGVLPVTQIDGKAVASGLPGALTRQLYNAYWQAHERPEWNKSVKINR